MRRAGSAQHGPHVANCPQRALERAGHLALPPLAGVVRHVHFHDPPSGVGGSYNHLQRPAEPTVDDPEFQEMQPPRRPHGADVPDSHVVAGFEGGAQRDVGDAGMDGPRSTAGPPSSHDQIGLPSHNGPGHFQQVCAVERAVAIHEAHHVGLGAKEAGETCRTEAAFRFVYHDGPQAGGQRPRSVGRTVVHHDGPEADGDRRQHARQRGALIQHRKDDIELWLHRAESGRDRRAGVRILVTGGGGFIGSHVVEALLSAGHEVRVVDRDPAWVVEGAELIRADLGVAGVAAAAVTGMDLVCHQAARVGLGVDFADAPGYVADNQLATATLLAALAEIGFSGRLVLASSMVVYGEGRYLCHEHGDVRAGPRLVADLEAQRFDPRCPVCATHLSWAPVDESAPFDPRSVYASSKVGQEHLCSSWARETGGSVVALRYHNVYGPRLPIATPYAGVAALWSTSLQRGEAPRVFEDGHQTRDFVHVTDVAAANVAALTAPLGEESFDAVNVCSGVPATIGDVATGLCRAYGPRAPRPVVTGEYRLGDVRHVVASPERAKSVIGFEARVDLGEGLAGMVDDYLLRTAAARRS